MVQFLLTIDACDFYSARCSRHGKNGYDFHDIKLPVATIVVGFSNVFQKPRHSSFRTRQSQASCRLDLHETTRVVDLS